jgi:mitogen-activated protein kinase 1/3
MLLDIILPKEVTEIPEESKSDDGLPDLDKFDHIFIVMNLGFSDFKKLLNSVPNTEITEQHVITLLYN